MNVFEKEWKIVNVTDSETGEAKPKRIGRTGEFLRYYSDKHNIATKAPLLFLYSSEDVKEKTMRTSLVVGVEYSDDGKNIVVQTENSVYYFEAVN